MADNVTTGAGLIATDEVSIGAPAGTAHVQIIKPVFGPLGTSTFVEASVGLPTNVVTVPTLTKGTQGATGFTVQELKDAGRNTCNYFMALPIVTTNAEVMQSLAGYKSGAEVGATATPAVVTAGKTYRIQSMTITYIGITTAGSVLARLRANTSGVAVITSPLVSARAVGASAGVGVAVTQMIEFPDGLEFAAGTGIAIGMKGLGPTCADLAAGYASILISGYEY